MGIRMKLTLKGFEEYFAKIEAAGRSVEAAVREAIPASAVPVHDDVKAWAEKHKITGAVSEGVMKPDVQQDGNFIYSEVGIDPDADFAWHATFVEYGSPTNDADPGIRRAFEENKNKVRQIQRKILKQRGVPIE